MSDSIFNRPLTIDEVKKVSAFCVEMRSTFLNTYYSEEKEIVWRVDDEAVHFITQYKPYFLIGEFDNYNVGWRAWLTDVSEEVRKANPWDEIRKCNGIGYDWERNVDELLEKAGGNPYSLVGRR